MALADFVSELGAPERSLVVINRRQPEPVQRMLADLFADQPVTVEDADVPNGEPDVVALVDDGEVVATSPYADLMQSVLLVNSDLYVTGTRGLDEVELPDVLDGLDDTPFRLRGYPESNKEKLLLVTVSRHIEREAWAGDGGTLRSSFQELSRIEDERGTRSVYERLAASGTDVHVYGVPDRMPPFGLDLVAHGGYRDEFRDAWFVVYEPRESGGDPAALVAIEAEPRVWEGFWTYDPGRVREINRYVERNL